MRQDCSTHVTGIHHRRLDRGMTLCVGQNDKEEAQNIQDLTCHDINECWRKACKDQIVALTVGKTGRHLKK